MKTRLAAGRVGYLLAAAALVAAGLVVGAGRAAAAPGPVYGEFTLDGSSGGFSGTMTLARGFPAATFASNSIAPAAAPSGATAFLRAGTPFAAQYGASQGHGYLNLRPAANSAGAPSTTTYDFSSPTPASGWGFVLGDIDAGSVAVSGTGPGFEPVAVADLGFAGTFNYCSSSLAAPAPSACAGTTEEVPTWDPVTGVLTGNAAAIDTDGASGWFQPTVPLSSLTFVFTWRAGFPVYQTWFATETAALSGTVTAIGGGGLPGASVEILASDGTIAGTATTGADGTYSFEGLARQQYLAHVVAPAGYATPGGDSDTFADLSDGDLAGFNFELSPLFAVGGTVTAGGRPVPGATIDCFDQGQAPTGTVFTDAAGVYSCPPVTLGKQYSVILMAVPDGYALAGNTFLGFDVDAAVTDLDFSVISNLTIGGSVVDEQGSPVPDAPVDLLDEQGNQVDSTTTDSKGAYEFQHVPGGTYRVVAGPTGEFVQSGVDGVVAGGAPVPTITLLPPPPLTTTPTPSTVTATPATVTSTVAAVTSTVSSTSVVAAVKYLSDTGSHASELLPVGAGLVGVGGVLLLFGRRRRGTHLG